MKIFVNLRCTERKNVRLNEKEHCPATVIEKFGELTPGKLTFSSLVINFREI